MSKKPIATLLLALALLGAAVGAHLQNAEKRYVVYQGFNTEVLQVLEARGETYRWEGRDLVLTTRDVPHLLATLSIARESQEKASQVYCYNRGNRVTIEPTGQPYRRLSPVFNTEGVFQGVEADQGDFCWVEEPGNPRTVVAGPHAGRVAYPNICQTRENRLIREANEQVSRLTVLMCKLDAPELTTFNPTWMGPSGDPFADSPTMGSFLSMGVTAPEPKGHQCDAACVTLPEGIKGP